VEKQKLITFATLQGQEKEREGISKELHDNVNQIISSTKLYLEVIKNNPSENLDLVYKAIENLNLVLEENRKLSKSLAPPSLGHISLKEAINDLIEDIHLSGKIQIIFNDEENTGDLLTGDIKLTLYRITQEGINNTMKYANAKNAIIKLSRKKNDVLLTIEDDGIGFDPDQKRKGIGITNIINRASLYNGHVTIDTGRGTGCKIIVSLPL
jgi:two-component system, NarL family, sensor histidine kinase UhpB